MENNSIDNRIEKLIKNKNRKKLTAVIVVLGVLVAVLTSYGLSRTGQAETYKVKELTCQYVVHQHTESCYSLVRGELICTQMEHTHTGECYDENGNLICGCEEHTHTDACYNMVNTLTCGYADYAVHVHNDDCYDSNGNLVCTLPEIQPHVHTDACYQDQQVLACGMETGEGGHVHTAACYSEQGGELICETEEHTHTDDCYSQPELICEKEEHTHTDECYDEEGNLICEEEEHTHSDDCYSQPELICGKEEHTHTDECYSPVETVLTCGKEVGEGGHVHTDACYQTEKVAVCGQNELHTHTDDCYEKDEYGNSTGKLICGKLQLEEHVHGEECFTTRDMTADEVQNMEKELEEQEAAEQSAESSEVSEATEESSEVSVNTEESSEVSVDTEESSEVSAETEESSEVSAETEESSEVSAETEESSEVSEVTEETSEESAETEESSETSEETEESSEVSAETEESSEVSEETGETSEESAETEESSETSEEEQTEETFTQTAETENYIITATYTKEAEIPDGARFQAKEITSESDPEEYETYLEQLRETYGENYQVNWMIDSGFYYIDGVEIEPKAAVDIRITAKESAELSDDTITHFRESDDSADLEEIDPEMQDDGSIGYTQNSFSISVSGGTNKGNSTYEIKVGDTITLTDSDSYHYNHQWSSSSSKIATVSGSNSSATVTGVSAGTTKITHTYSSRSVSTKSETITINVVAATSSTYTVRFYANTGNSGGTNSTLVATKTYTVNENGTVTVQFDDVSAPSTTNYTSGGVTYQFYGWSTVSDATFNKNSYIYSTGTVDFKTSDFTNGTLTLYGAWGQTSYSENRVQYFIRYDGTVPNEPTGFSSSLYTDSVGDGKYNNTSLHYLMHIYNDHDALYANIINEPTADEIAKAINAKSSNMGGLSVEAIDGKVYVKTTSTTSMYKDFKVGDELYVEWYVLKKETTWHIDGALRSRSKWSLKYDQNCSETVANIIPNLQYNTDTAATVHNTVQSGTSTQVSTVPTRVGYEFMGWNLEKDGSGTWYKDGESIGPGTADQTITLYAQWTRGSNTLSVSKKNTEGTILQGAQFTLETKAEATDAWTTVQSFTTNAKGVFTYSDLKNINIYRLTEVYAPLGNQTRNSFCFTVNVDNTGKLLAFYFTDESGNHVDAPDWINPTYNQVASYLSIQLQIEDQTIEQSVTFKKVDANDTTKALKGAVYKLYKKDSSGNYQEVTGKLLDVSGTDGIFSSDKMTLSYGEYKLVEETAPDGYDQGADVYFRINDPVDETGGLVITNGAEANISAKYEEDVVTGLNDAGDEIKTKTYSYTFTVKDEPAEVPVKLLKVSNQKDDTMLSGAEFTLIDSSGNSYVCAETTGEGGEIYKGNLPEGSYTLTETKAPDGYILLTSPITFTVADGTVKINNSSTNKIAAASVDDKKDSYGNVIVRISNSAGTMLPATGGSGTILFYLIGIGLITLAAVSMGLKFRRRKR